MSSVVQMLVNDAALPQPKEPGFFSGKREINNELSSDTHATSSINEVTMTSIHPR